MIRNALPWFLTTIRSVEFWSGAAICGMLLLIWLNRHSRRMHRVTKVHLNLPFGLGNIEYDTTEYDRKIAWQIYIQLKTRKAALFFDEDHDLISEVYDSLHELFPLTRDLLTNMPLHEAARTDGVVGLMLRVLNDGLRPHLTKYQASFRWWWRAALSEAGNRDKTPQAIQRLYPDYPALIQDLKQMNVELSKYAADLLTMVQAPKRKKADTAKTVIPEQPQSSDLLLRTSVAPSLKSATMPDPPSRKEE